MDFEIKSKKQIQFEFGLNFKGVQTFDEKFNKFPKNLFYPDIQNCEFRIDSLVFQNLKFFYKW
jgi:hypothetical protein